MQFERDPEKAAGNKRRHAITFEEASTVFAGPPAITFADPDHCLDEDRYLTFGLSRPERLSLVSHCPVPGDIGPELPSIEGRVAALNQARLPVEPQNMREKTGRRFQMAPAQLADGVVIGAPVSRYDPKRDILMSCFLDPAGAGYPRAADMEKKGRRHRGVVRGLSPSVSLHDSYIFERSSCSTASRMKWAGRPCGNRSGSDGGSSGICFQSQDFSVFCTAGPYWQKLASSAVSATGSWCCVPQISLY